MSDCNESKGPTYTVTDEKVGPWTMRVARYGSPAKMKYEEVEAAERAADDARAKMFDTYVAYLKSHRWEPAVDYAKGTVLWKNPRSADSDPETLEDAVSYEHNIGMLEKNRAETEIKKLKAEHGIGGEV
jgi:hypothetical protein